VLTIVPSTPQRPLLTPFLNHHPHCTRSSLHRLDPAPTDRIDDSPISIASVISGPFILAHPNITFFLHGSVSFPVTLAFSSLISDYLSGVDHPISIMSSIKFFSDYSAHTKFPLATSTARGSTRESPCWRALVGCCTSAACCQTYSPLMDNSQWLPLRHPQ
jgi:hypothetical protein